MDYISKYSRVYVIKRYVQGSANEFLCFYLLLKSGIVIYLNDVTSNSGYFNVYSYSIGQKFCGCFWV